MTRIMPPTDLPVSVSREQGHGGFRTGENRDQEPVSGQRGGQLHHHLHPQSEQ